MSAEENSQDANFNNFENTPILDNDQFDALVETLGDEAKEFIQDLLTLFIDEYKPNIDELKTALESSDFDKISKKAHTLSGSSSNIGGMRLAEICMTLERDTANDDWDTIRHLTNIIQITFDITINELQQAIDKL